MDLSLSGLTQGIWQYRNMDLDYGNGIAGGWDNHQDSRYSYYHSGVYQVALKTVDLLGRPAYTQATAVAGTDYVPLSGGPKRVYDSRSRGIDSVPAHGTVRLAFDIAGGSKDAVVVNLTTTNTRAAGFLTAYPDGTSRPSASNLNFAAGQTRANQATVAVGTDGYVDFYNGSGGPVDLVVDQVGVQDIGNFGTEYHPATPSRILDTRTPGQHQVPGHGTLTLQVPPALLTSNGPDTVELNLTVADERSAGFASVYTAGQSRPATSSLNWSGGTPVANLVTVTADSQGRVTIYNGGSAAADFVVDFLGLYAPQTGTGPVTGFVPVTPRRVLDTRYGTGAPTGQLAPGRQIRVCIPGPAGISAAALNVTVTGSSGPGWLSAYPDGSSRPATSSVNWTAGATVANMTQTPTGTDGCVELFNGGGAPVSVIADLFGYQDTQQ